MLVLGLTGVSGSGKGYVCGYFEKYSLAVIDTDSIVHSLYVTSAKCISALVEAFGKGILQENGSIDRKALRSIVFSDRKALEKLNAVVHAFTLDKVRELIEKYKKEGKGAVVVDAPQLFESGFDAECDKVISVVSSREKRIERICKRDNITVEDAALRLANQHDDEYFKERSDFVISNDTEDVEPQVRKILAALGLL